MRDGNEREGMEVNEQQRRNGRGGGERIGERRRKR